MNRLLRAIPLGRLGRRLDCRGLRLGAEALFWLAAAAGFELFGRHSPSDWVDLFAGAALIGLGLATAGAPCRFALPRRAVRLARRAGNRLEALFDASYGADFHPDLEPRLPRLRRYRLVIAGLVGVDLALGGLVAAVGSPLHALLSTSYVLYLMVGAFIWLGLAVALTSLALTLLQQLRMAPGRRRRPLGRRRAAAIGGGLALAAAALVELDARVGAEGWLVALTAALLVLAPPRLGPRVEFRLNLRLRGGEGLRLETTTVEEMVRSFLAVLVLGSLALALVIQGHRLPFAAETAAMAARLPLAHYAGRAVAWAVGVGAGACALLYLYEFTLRRWRSDPAVPGPVATDREALIARVEKNMELARGGRRDRGEGFLFAPHWWPSDRMYRDSWSEDDLSEGSAGPDFHRHYGQPARRQLRHLLRGLEIDLIYIEDGVPARRLGDVMRFLFSRFDAAPGVAITDRDLKSPPGVHLALQEIELDAPRCQLEAGYKEPSYESLSRARVLLVLRDRGGEEAPAEDPFAFTSEPGWVDRLLSHLPVGPVGSAV